MLESSGIRNFGETISFDKLSSSVKSEDASLVIARENLVMPALEFLESLDSKLESSEHHPSPVFACPLLFLWIFLMILGFA